MIIVVSDSEQGHADTCKAKILLECPTATIYTRLESLAASITWGSSNNVDIISRSMTGLSDYVNENEGVNAEAVGIGIVHAHGSNSHVRLTNPSRLDLISAVGGGSGGSNIASYGPGLEFFNPVETTESYATARTAGVIGQLMIDNPTWNFHDARQALRQTADEYATGWIEDGGYGEQDKTNAALVSTFELSSPIRKSYINNDNQVNFSWINNPQSDFNNTVVAIFDTEPTRTTEPTAQQIIYEGALESFDYNHFTVGAKWFAFYTRNSSLDYSLVEHNSDASYWFDKVSIILTAISQTDPPFNGSLVGNPTREKF